jgi:hypothetical protein
MGKPKKGEKTIGYDISHIKPKALEKGTYIGAEYIGRDGLQYSWGVLTKGETYSIIKEDEAIKNKDIFKAIYQNKEE